MKTATVERILDDIALCDGAGVVLCRACRNEAQTDGAMIGRLVGAAACLGVSIDWSNSEVSKPE